MNQQEEGIKIVKILYDNLSFIDLYGASVISFVCLTLIEVLLIVYFNIKINIEFYKDNWITYKCNPLIMPFAGIINKPPDETNIGFAEKNFSQCVQSLNLSLSSYQIQPLQFIVGKTYD